MAGAAASAVLGRGSAAWVHYGAGEHRARLVGSLVENDEYAVVSPDFDVYVEQLSLDSGDLGGIRFSASVDARPRGAPAPGNVLYTFAAPTPAEVNELLAEADQVCNLERAHRGPPLLGEAARAPGGAAAVATPMPAVAPAPGAPRLAPAGGAWVLAEPLVGHDIGEEFTLPAGAAAQGTRALAVIDGGVAALEQSAEGADIARWALARRNFLCDDPRILARSPTERTLADAGPAIGAEWVDSVVRDGATSLIDRAGKWRRGGGVKTHSSTAHEHAIPHRAVQLLATVDGLNAMNLVGVELLLRRITLHEEAVAENPEAPSYEGSDHYLGISERSGGAQMAPSLRAHVATELSKETANLREERKAREARAAGVAVAKAKADPSASAKSGLADGKKQQGIGVAAVSFPFLTLLVPSALVPEAVDGLNLLFGCDPQELSAPTQRDGTEALHAELLREAGFGQDLIMSNAWPAPPLSDDPVALPYCDNLTVFGMSRDRVDQRLCELIGVFEGKGFVLREISWASTSSDILGTAFDGLRRTVRARVLERLLGHYVVEGLSQRPALSVLRASDVFIRDCYWTPRPLWDSVCREILVCSSLVPKAAILGRSWECWRAGRYRFEEPIGNKEGRAVIKGMSRKLRGPCQHHKRRLVLVDNVGVAFCFSRGRAASFGFLPLVRRLAALSIATGAWVALRWVPSECNPADEPSRLFEELGEARAALYEAPAAGAELGGLSSSRRATDFLRSRWGPTGGKGGGLSACELATVGAKGSAAYQHFENLFRERRRRRGRAADDHDEIEVNLLDYLDEPQADNVKLTRAEKTVHGPLCSAPLGKVRDYPRLQRAPKGYRKRLPPTSRMPLPIEVKSGICALLIYDGERSTALYVEAMFSVSFRPGEFLRAQVGDLPSKTQTFDGTVIFDHPEWLGEVLGSWAATAADDRELFPLEAARVARLFKAAADRLGVEAPLRQLRHGGASDDLLKRRRTLSEIQPRAPPGSEGGEQHALPAPPTDLLVEFDDVPGRAVGAVAFRPGVRRFLEAAARRFEVVVFTASQQSYADKVIDALDPSGLLVAHRLYRGHCTEYRGAFFKDLGHLGRPLARCVLVDNSPISVALNPDNGILIPELVRRPRRPGARRPAEHPRGVPRQRPGRRPLLHKPLQTGRS
ncbi:unnamed protein product [Prorocentrum cordatum]|uniref:FCP1 homology domain-containing protein n=1 Tax=Prorocentrum cordatum TaxID=2364126 RepID=A0ABN9SD19_9DINO|nr:unnamed protein product [Polarella glacialis]